MGCICGLLGWDSEKSLYNVSSPFSSATVVIESKFSDINGLYASVTSFKEAALES